MQQKVSESEIPIRMPALSIQPRTALCQKSGTWHEWDVFADQDGSGPITNLEKYEKARQELVGRVRSSLVAFQ